MSTLFSAFDADGDTIVYLFNDPTPGGGHFELNGVIQHDGDGQYFGVSAANLPNLTFVPGASGSNALWIGATDLKSFSGWTIEQVNVVNHAPVVTVPNLNVSGTQGVPLQVSTLFSAFDADGDTIVYLFNDPTPGGGHFELNGVAQHDGDGQYFAVSAANLPNLTFVPGASGSNALWIGATDLKSFSGWTVEQVSVVNQPPVVTVPNLNVSGTQGVPIQVSALFSATDANGDAIVYLFNDPTPGGGHFELNGVAQHDGDGQYFAVGAANLPNLTFVPGASGSNALWIGATDLKSFSGWTIAQVNLTNQSAMATGPDPASSFISEIVNSANGSVHQHTDFLLI